MDTYRQHRDSRLGFSLGRCLSGTCTILYRTPGLPWCADTMSGARCASRRCGGSSWSRDCGLLRLFVCPRVATPPTDNDTNSVAERTERTRAAANLSSLCLLCCLQLLNATKQINRLFYGPLRATWSLFTAQFITIYKYTINNTIIYIKRSNDFNLTL